MIMSGFFRRIPLLQNGKLGIFARVLQRQSLKTPSQHC